MSTAPNPNQITVPSPTTPYHTNEDNASLLSINPSTIFLHDGVLRSLQLKSLKEFEQHAKYHDALTISSTDEMEELMAIGLSNTVNSNSAESGNSSGSSSSSPSPSVTGDLSRKIIRLSTLHVQAIGLHHRYQWHVLERVWRYQRARAVEALEREAGSRAVAGAENEKEAVQDPTTSSHLGFKLSLCLLVPMLEMYSNQNQSVALSALQLIFSELASVPVMSLSQESSNSLEKLEDLLHQWAANPKEEFHISGPSAMIALACARGTISSFAKTILLLENLESPLRLLPVASILRKLNDSRTKGIGKPCAISGEKHILTWAYDDRLIADSVQNGKTLGTKTHPYLSQQMLEQEEPETSAQLQLVPLSPRAGPPPPPLPPPANRPAGNNPSGGGSNIDDIQKHSVATDGSFLFVTGPNGKGLSKVGTGMRGTLQGWVYHNNVELNCGYLAYVDGLLLSRPQEFDKIAGLSMHDYKDKTLLGVTIDQDTLKPDKLILAEGAELKRRNLVTIGLTSDGFLLYRVRAELPPPPVQVKEGVAAASEASFLTATTPTPIIQVWLETYTLNQASGSSFIKAVLKGSPVLLSRQEEQSLPNLNGNANLDRVTPPSITIGGGGVVTVSDDRPGPVTIRRTRSVRITPAPPPPPPPGVGTQPSSSSYENMNTSLNMTLKQLQTGLYFACGNYLSIAVSTNVHLFLAANAQSAASHGPSTPVMPTYRQYCAVLSPTCSKSQGFHLHVNLLKSGSAIVKDDLSNLPVDSSFYHGAIIPEMGATYDPTNNLIWTVNGQLVDCWKNPGHIPPWKQDHLLLLGNTLNHEISFQGKDGQMADVRTVINVMLRHVGIMANHFLQGDRQEADIGFGLMESGKGPGSVHVIRTLIQLVLKYREKYQGAEMTAIFLILQAIVSQLKSDEVEEKGAELKESLHDVQIIVLGLLNGFADRWKPRDRSEVYGQACALFAMTFDLLHNSFQSRNEFFQEIYEFVEKTEDMEETITCLQMLEESILQRFTESLNEPVIAFDSGLKWIVDSPWLSKIIQSCTEEVRSSFAELSTKAGKLEEVIRLSSRRPVATIRTRYVGAVVNFLLKCLTLPQSGRSEMDMAVEVFREVLKGGANIVENCQEFIGGLEGGLRLAEYNCVEGVLKGSLLGRGIPQILAFLSLDKLPVARPILDELTEECIQLTVAMSFLANKMNPVSEDLGSDWSSEVRIPSPWNTKKVFESPHPIRESWKTKETIVIPEARQLYMKLNPQSATQYDYDRLCFFRDTKKVVEFGGNYYGYGNRFFSGPGWARTLIKLGEGNAITYSFEMKSGREHAVPDKALHGYSFTVFPVMDYSDKQKPSREQGDEQSLNPVTTGFATISALHCIDVIQNVARSLLEGSEPTTEEKWNGPLLENKFLVGLKWPQKQGVGDDPIPRKFSTELIAKLKRTVGVPPLQMRLSIIEKMRAPELEELYLQCCLQHIGPNPYLNLETILSPICESCWSLEPTRDLLREIFNLINTLFRKLMAFYEMEKMLSQEIEEISNGTKEIGEAFFTDATFLENPTDLQTLAWICYLEYDKENPMNLINDVIGMVNALSADGTPPTLTRTDELIEETHLKCRYLLGATPVTNVFGPVYPTQKVVLEKLHNIHGFISSHMANPNSTMNSFFEALRSRRERAGERIKGLDILHKILECSSPSASLLIVASTLLQSGPRLGSILCSGLEVEVLRIFGEVMKIAVGIAEKNPLLHRYTIALLSVTGYDRTDEENFVESGLVGLLDQLCAFQTGHLTPLYQRSSPTQTGMVTEGPPTQAAVQIHNKASTLAWAAFQVLAGQCASWERPSAKHGHTKQETSGTGKEVAETADHTSSEWDEPEHRELPLQISINITNHLARAAALAALSSSGAMMVGMDERSSCSPSLSVAIQDVLDLLNNLRKYKIGRAILKQSPCICRLLGLLQDSRLSPRLVLTILQLLHTALPLVDDLDTANFKQIVPVGRVVPPSGPGGVGARGVGQQQHAAAMSSFWTVIESTPYTQVGSMLLSKLADYLVCGSNKPVEQAKISCFQGDEWHQPRRGSQTRSMNGWRYGYIRWMSSIRTRPQPSSGSYLWM